MARRRDSCFLQPPPPPPPPLTGAGTMLPAVLPTLRGQRPELASLRGPGYCHSDVGLKPLPVLEKTMRVCCGDRPVPGLSRCLRGSSRFAKPPGVWLRLPPRGHVAQESPRAPNQMGSSLTRHSWGWGRGWDHSEGAVARHL